MNSSAEEFGRLMGLGISIILPLVLIILNGVSMRRRRTNTFCALAIIGTLLALILFSLSGLGARTTHVSLQLLETLSISGGVLMLITTVLAIIGLVKCLQRRRHVRGRWRAIIALGLNAVFLTFLTVNIMAGVNQGLAWRKLLQPTSTGGTPVANEAWNFRLQPPPEWSPIDPSAFGPQVRAAFSRKDPEMYALVLSEDLPEGADTPLSGAMDVLKESLRAGGTVEFLGEEERMEHDFLARTLEMRSHDITGHNFHVFWMTREGSTLYRITIWGANDHGNQVRDEAHRIIDGFQLIDSRRKAKATPKPTVASMTIPWRADVVSFNQPRRQRAAN